MTDGHRNPIVAQGRNCWRIARAEKASVIVDAADYYRIIAAAMEAAQHELSQRRERVGELEVDRCARRARRRR